MDSSKVYTGPFPYLATLEIFLTVKKLDVSSLYKGMLEEYNTSSGDSPKNFKEWCEWAEPRLARSGYPPFIVTTELLQQNGVGNKIVLEFAQLANNLINKGALKPYRNIRLFN